MGGAVDQHTEAGIGETRARIAHDRMNDLAVAALDEHVGHRFAQGPPPRDREQMLLALGAGADQQVALVKTVRERQHRAGYVDVVVEGEHVDDVRRRVGDRREPLRQSGAGLALDGIDQPRHDVVEHSDLIFGILRGIAEEEVGDAGQYVDTARDAARRQRGFELVEQREATHYDSGRPQRHAINANNAAGTVNKAFRSGALAKPPRRPRRLTKR